jgi:hypothetical protein
MPLLTDDMDIRDTTLDVWVGGNGDYYLSLRETRKGQVIRIDTRISTNGGNATAQTKLAIAELYASLHEDVDVFYSIK